jgi:hypothetical protein
MQVSVILVIVAMHFLAQSIHNSTVFLAVVSVHVIRSRRMGVPANQD